MEPQHRKNPLSPENSSKRSKASLHLKKLDRWQRIRIHQLSFSPHTDAKGIMDLISFLSPKHVMLVHGEKPKMATLKARVESELGIPCFYPANNESLSVPTDRTIKLDLTKPFLRNCFNDDDEGTAEGILMMEKNKTAKIVSENDLLRALDAEEHAIQLAFCCPVGAKNGLRPSDCSNGAPSFSLPELLLRELGSKVDCGDFRLGFDHLRLKSFRARVCLNEACCYRIEKGGSGCESNKVFFCCGWSWNDDVLARKLISVMREVELDMSNIALVQDQVAE